MRAVRANARRMMWAWGVRIRTRASVRSATYIQVNYTPVYASVQDLLQEL